MEPYKYPLEVRIRVFMALVTHFPLLEREKEREREHIDFYISKANDKIMV